MIIGEIMIDGSHFYDLEEGEILEDDDEEEINVSNNYHNSPCHIVEDNLQLGFHSDTEKYFGIREESRYTEKLYLPSEENFLPEQNLRKYPRKKDISSRVRTFKHSSDYKQKINKSSTFRIQKKSRSRSRSVSSSSSSSSSCSCSSCSCTSCSISSIDGKRVQHPSHSTGGSRYSKPSCKYDKEIENYSTHLQRRKEMIEKAVKAKIKKERNSSSSRLLRDRIPDDKLTKLIHKDSIVSRSRTNFHRRDCLPEKSSKRRVGSQSTKSVRSKNKGPLKSRYEVSEKYNIIDIIADTDLTMPKLIPGSLGEMLLKKRLRGELKKDSVPSSEKGRENNEGKPIFESSKNFEIVDLCHDNEDESEEDELTLRIKALQSTMKTRGLIGIKNVDQREGNQNESANLDNENQINCDASSKIDFNVNKEDMCKSENPSAISMFKNEVDKTNTDSEKFNTLNNHHNILEQRNYSSKTTFIDNAKIEIQDLDSGMTAEDHPEGEEVNNHSKLVKDKCEIASIDMDISNDSFGDSVPTQSENNESETNTAVVNQDTSTVCQDSTFPIPVEWAYMIPPPPCNTDQPDDDSLSNIRNWCFNQNMYVQSMQESVSTMNPVESWKSAEANSFGADCYNSSNTTTTTNYYYQPPVATSETCRVTYDEYQCDYNVPIVTAVDTSVQSGELRDCHAEQYKSFMSTVIQNNCSQASHKKDQHRDLINIDLKPENFQNSNLVSLKPDKLNIVKRRSRKRRRSNRKSGNGNNLPIILKNNQEISKTEKCPIDEDDEDMLRAMLLNEMSFKNQRVSQNKQNTEININNNNNNNRVIGRKKYSNRNDRLVKAGKSLEISYPNQNSKFRKTGLQAKSKWQIERRSGLKTNPKSKSQNIKTSEQKFVNLNDITLRNFSLSKFPPVKPVIININEDSESEEEQVRKAKSATNYDDQLISGIDRFIKSLRNKQTIEQEKSKRPSSIPTPKGVSHLSDEKQQEYRRLKQLLFSKGKGSETESKKAITLPSKWPSEDKKDILFRNIEPVESKLCESIEGNEPNMNLSIKFSSNLDNTFESEERRDNMSIQDCENKVGEKINCNEHLVEASVANTQIIFGDQEIHNLDPVENIAVSSHLKVNKEEKLNVFTKNYPENDLNDGCINSENIENYNKENKVISMCDNLESDDILNNNLQSQLIQDVSKSNECLDESIDSSDDSSSSDEESSSSSSNDSDTDMEEQTEIDLRNRLLRKRQELLQKVNEPSSSHGGQSLENCNILLECDQNKEASSIENQDEFMNSVSTNKHLSSCEERKNEIEHSDSPITKEIKEKENIPGSFKEEVAPPGNAPFKTVLLSLSTDSMDKSNKNETVKPQFTNSGLKSQSVEDKVALTRPTLKKVVDVKNTLKVKQTKTQDKLARTLVKLQEEINNRILSAETLTSRISDLFLEAEKEDSFCQSTFSGIIKLLSQISELRKSRKEKKSQITGIFAKITMFLQKVNEDLSFVNKMENFLSKHYDLNQLLLLTSVKTKKKKQEEIRIFFLQKIKELRERVKLLDSQETILNKTFSKPLECTSSKTTASRGPISVIRPLRQNQKKKQFKLDNRQIFERHRKEGIGATNSIWKLNNNRNLVSQSASAKSTPTVVTAPSKAVVSRQQNEITKKPSSKSPSKIIEVIARGTAKQPDNDKFVDDIMLCPYDLLGRCNDDQCIYQHVSAAVGQVKSSVLSSNENTNDSNRQSQNECIFEIDKDLSSKKFNKQLTESSEVYDVSDIKAPSTVTSEAVLVKDVNTRSKEENLSTFVDLATLSTSILKEISHSENRLPNRTEYPGQTNSALPIVKSHKRKIITYSPLKGAKFSKSEENIQIDSSLEETDRIQFLSSLSLVRTPIDTEKATTNRKVTVIFDDQSPEKDNEKSEQIPNSSDESTEISGVRNLFSYPESSVSTINRPNTVGSTLRKTRQRGKRRSSVTITPQNKVKRTFQLKTLRSNKRVIRRKNFKKNLSKRT